MQNLWDQHFREVPYESDCIRFYLLFDAKDISEFKRTAYLAGADNIIKLSAFSLTTLKETALRSQT